MFILKLFETKYLNKNKVFIIKNFKSISNKVRFEILMF